MAAVPTRKLYHVAKLSLLVILVVTILTLFEHWHGGKRSAGATFSDPIETEYERQIIEDEARIVPGLGEGGAAAHLVGEEKKLGEESEKKLAINVYLSDRIPYNRTLKDFRNPTCTRVIYDAELPSASVILIFHNEPYSVVLRTLWSVINSARRSNEWFQFANFYDRQTGKTMNLGYSNQDPESPFVYIKEIILVDDSSTLPELKGKLSHYIRTRLPPDLIKILRLPERIGLTQARQAGSRVAKGDVLVFLDSHCEGSKDWLRPLLHRIKEKRTAVVTPLIDTIDKATFEYLSSELNYLEVGGFSFLGHFTWIDVPEREKKRRGSDIAPTWSPTMAGGLFAISRKYFFELGGYDEQMAGWGGENLEMSFRIWQCGGTLETIPCSRVGHVFRAFHPYGMPAESDTHGINTARMAEVWMDEYAELFYIHRPDLRNNPKIGDVTHRKILREKLRCKNFQWYLDNIYKEKFIPVRDAFGFGRFRNLATGMCLDSLQKDRDGAPLGYYPCHPEIQATQFYTFTNLGEIRDEQNCASVKVSRTPSRSTSIERASVASRPVIMTSCHGLGREQKWRRLPTGQLEHVDSKLCLQSTKNSEEARVEACRTAGYESQVWLIDYSEENGFHSETDLGGGIEREARINMLRGSHQRISRSLQSYPEQTLNNHVEPKDEGIKEETDNPKKHRNKGKQHKRHGHKKAKSRSHTKNKFILKLLRTLTNGTEDHLEVDIHCKHHQLYPNNSFVRDLVTILNDQNIKVVNNGRVFERNRVIDTRTETPANQDANVTPAEPKHSKPRTHRVKKRKHIPIIAPQTVNSATPKPAEYAEEERSPRPEPQDKRIIIEDFFKLEPPSTPAPTDASIVSERLPMFVHKPRKQHRRPKQPPSTPHPRADEQKLLQENWEKRKSDVVEETDSPVEDDNIIPDPSVWRMDPSQFRRKGDSQHSNDESLERAVHRARPRENIETTVAPVKVVLRSNLSFTLGDDVLRWRARATDDLVNEFLGELAIPTNNSHIHPQATTEVYERIRSSESSSESESDEVKSI